ncbi:MAG: RagB/SusD family nutrient uptake outer membrane protein [Bacteroidales bacterium]|nr:RagB/SusD family nutrient uptake outer membrane protein [Bacteroidales bacterium]
MKKIFVFVIAALALVSCKMDFYSSDSMTSSQLKDNPASAVYTTDGVYSLFKDMINYKGESPEYPNGRNQYLRHYFQLTELRSDNVTVSGVTSDPFVHPYAYADVPTEENIYYTWWMAYKIIYAANSNIDAIVPAEAGDQLSHMLGENYFFRAIAHFHLVTLFAQLYTNPGAPSTPGVIIHRGMDSYSGTPVRATVADVYDGIVEDLKSAIDLMKDGKSRGDHSYVSVEAAKALLARVYLYMGKDDECITLCDDLITNASAGAAKAITDGYDFVKYPTQTYAMDETIWCSKMATTDYFFVQHPTSSIGSMYYNDGTQGWGEHYWSDILIDLFQRYPEDKRFAAYFKMPHPATDGTVMVTFPIKTKATNANCSSQIVNGLTKKADGSVDFKYNGQNYTAVPTIVNTYTEYYVNGIDFVTGKTGGSEKSRVFVRPDGGNVSQGGVRDNGGQYCIYYNTKYSNQDGQAMLSSPVFLRWGEVVLNRAEAKAHKGDDAGALADVNIIRKRAGLPDEAMFSTANMHGYTDVLDVVLDERRMELCFEGLRYFDVFRNHKKMDRRYVGFHEYGEIDFTDKRIPLLIPLDEINSSGIEQNPR